MKIPAPGRDASKDQRLLCNCLNFFSAMPRENRKRGKRSKKHTQDTPIEQEELEDVEEQQQFESGPSWIVSRPQQTEELNSEAPFGYVDADIKAYFRTVDTQIRDWQEGGDQEETVQDENADPNAGR